MILFISQVAVFAETTTPKSRLTVIENHYKRAKDYYYRLQRDQTIRDDRLNWVKGTRKFRQIYLNDPKGKLAPNCLFMLGTMHYRMFLRFQIQDDLGEAITYYNDVWHLFPENTLADDALFWTAEIILKHQNETEKAAKLYARQIKRYPDGDKYAQALNRLREINDRENVSSKKHLDPASLGKELNKVLPVKYWSSDDYSRIVIRSSGPVTYTSELLAKSEDGSRKLFIDFAHSTVEKKYTAPVPIHEGLLQKIQSSQFSRNMVRITLDIESISTYKIFSLNDPFRVIVDIHGQQKALSASKSVPNFKPERIEPARKKVHSSRVGTTASIKKKTETGHTTPLTSPKSDTFIVLSSKSKRKPGVESTSGTIHDQNGLSLAQQLGLGVRRIVIDPGHGGKDPGAMGNGLKEKDITLKVAHKTAKILHSKYKYEVILTRASDRSLPLEERTAIANTQKADLFISIHVNAHPNKETRGVETFYLNLATNTEAMRVAALENATSTLNISDMQDILTDLMQNSKIEESSILADYVQNKIVSGLTENRYFTMDLGVKQAPFYVLIGAEMPAILAEISFISNAKDAKMLKQENFLDEVARQIAAGIDGYADHQATAALQL